MSERDVIPAFERHGDEYKEFAYHLMTVYTDVIMAVMEHAGIRMADEDGAPPSLKLAAEEYRRAFAIAKDRGPKFCS